MSGLEEEFPGRVKAVNEDATTPAGRQAVADLGFASHGLVIRSPDGEPIFTQKDHTVKMDEVRAELRRLVGG